MLKILNVNMALDPINGGGTAERTFQISKALARVGTNCAVLTTNTGLCQDRINGMPGVKIIALPNIFARYHLPGFSYGALKSLIQEYDIVHLMNHWSALNAVVFLLVKKLNKPYAVCPAGALPIYGRSKLVKKLYNRVIGDRIIRDANAHIAIAINEFEHFKKYGIRKEKLTVIPNGISPDDFLSKNAIRFRKKYKLTADPIIMFVGRLNSIKGPDLLLKAFACAEKKFKKLQLVFAGPDGGMLKKLRRITEEKGISDKVNFIGYIDADNKSDAYHAADIVAIPSRQEAMSIVVLEAGIAGTPVLITDQCGFNEIEVIGGGKVVPATVQGLKTGLCAMLSNGEKLIMMGKKLKNYVGTNYTWDIIIRKYLDLYHNILAL